MAAKTITTMSDEQWAELARYREEWYRIGSATGATDRALAQETITTMYAAIGQMSPHFLWVQSPATAWLEILLFSWRGSLGESLGELLRGSLRGSLRESLEESLGGSLRESLRGSLWELLRGSLRESLRELLRESLRELLRGSLGGSLRESLWGYFAGQHEGYWIAFYQWGSRIGVRYDKQLARRLEWWATLARSNGWWWPFQNVCIVADRPTITNVDPQYRLHCEDGPAMAFADGYRFWAWHGVRVPQNVIENPETLTVAQIHAEQNAERRRVMIERWGWERYLAAVNATLRDVDTEPAGAAGSAWALSLPRW